MGRKLISLWILFSLIFSAFLVGCVNRSILEKYQFALEQTEKIDKAKELVTFELNMDLDQSNLTEDEKKNLHMYSTTKGHFFVQYDKIQELFYLDGHVDMKSFGFDLKIYQNSENTVLLLPSFSKYMIIENSKFKKEGTTKNAPASENEENLDEVWKNAITKNNIKKLDDQMISTEEGEVKASTYQISLNPDEVKKLMETFLKMLSNDPDMKQSILTFTQKSNQQKILSDAEKEKLFQQMISQIKSGIDSQKAIDFRYSAAIDKDSYVIKENIDYRFTFEFSPDKPIETLFSYETKRWDMGKEIEFSMPNLNEANSFSIEEFDKNVPKVFKQLSNSFKN